MTRLPPKERASVLLKDVFGYSHEEIADCIGSTVGGVKAALSRGRTKLAGIDDEPTTTRNRQTDPKFARLLQRYVELFNQRDWDGVRALTSADAKLGVADCYRGRLADSPYFAEYENTEAIWRMESGYVDGELVGIVSNRKHGRWQPAYFVQVRAAGDVIVEITDYYACPWLQQAAQSVETVCLDLASPSSPRSGRI